MTAHQTLISFRIEMQSLFAAADVARAEMVKALSAMEANPSNENIEAYFDAIEAEKEARAAIGRLSDKEEGYRSDLAGIPAREQAPVLATSHGLDASLSAARLKHEASVFGPRA